MYSDNNKTIAIDISSISDASNRYLVNKFSTDTQRSFHTIQDYVNNTLYPILKTLTSGPVYSDVIQTGLSGETIISYLSASDANGPMFWDVNNSRAKTIKESLSYIQSVAIGSQTILNTIIGSDLENRVETLESQSDLQNSNIENLEENLLQLAKDCFGDTYSLNSDGQSTTPIPLSELFIPSSLKGVSNGVATLDSNGKVPISQIPDLAITSVQVVADIAARDALNNVQVGDVVKTSDDNKVYMLQSSTPKTWIEVNADVQDLSDYARKSMSNTFIAKNIFKNDSENEILTIEDNSQPFAKFLKNEKQFETFNLISGKNLTNPTDKGFSEFHGEAFFKTTNIKIGTLNDGNNSNDAPIEIGSSGKMTFNSYGNISRKIANSDLPIADKYFLKLNTNQMTTEDAHILKIGVDVSQENFFSGFLKWSGQTGDFLIHKSPELSSYNATLATTRWVVDYLNAYGTNVNTNNLAKLNADNIYNVGITNHFKGEIKSDRVINLTSADQAYIKRPHLGSEMNLSPLLLVEEDTSGGIWADKRTVLVSVERANGANTAINNGPAEIYWSEDPNDYYMGANDGSWKLSHSPHSSSNDYSIATTDWVLEKVNAIGGESVDPLVKNNIQINEKLKFKDITGPSIVFNYDTPTLSDANTNTKNAIIHVYRGTDGTPAEIKWNETTDVWEISPEPLSSNSSNAIATTSWISNKIDSILLNDLSDVTLNDLTDNKVLKYNSTLAGWSAAQLSSSNLSNDSVIAKKNLDNNFTAVQRGTTPADAASSTELVTAVWVKNLINSIGANPITTLNSLTDVATGNVQNNHYLKYSNDKWINSVINVSDINGLTLSNYAPIMSPSFTGAPSLAANATELPADDSSRRLVTSAWVRNLISVNTSFDGILTDKSLTFQPSDNSVDGIVWNTYSATSTITINKILSKTTLANTVYKTDGEYYLKRVIFNNNATSTNLGRVRPGFPHITNEIPESGNFSHNIFINGNNYSLNNSAPNTQDQIRSRYTVTYLDNNGTEDANSRILYQDPNIPINSFCFINPFSKDLFLLSNNTFITDGTFNNQKLFVKNVSSSNIKLGINSCEEIFPDNSMMNELTTLRKFYTLPSKASIEFIWLSFYKGYYDNNNLIYIGAWYPKVITGNVTVADQSGQMSNGSINITWPPSLVDTVNKFFPAANNSYKNLT